MRERLTMMNHDGKTYRIACAMDTEELHNIRGPGGYPSLLGKLVDQLGKLEEIKPIEKWLEETKKISTCFWEKHVPVNFRSRKYIT